MTLTDAMVRDELERLEQERAVVDRKIAALKTYLGEDAPEPAPAQPTASIPTSDRPEPAQRQPKENRPWVEHQTGAKRQRGEPCAECGSKGWRHYKSCSQNGEYTRKVVGDELEPASHGRTILDEPEKISAEDWAEMKEEFDDGVATDMLKLSYPQYDPMEIKRAVKFDSYEEYRG